MKISGTERGVLVGTYRLENAAWIRARRLDNLPIAEKGDAAAFKRFAAVVLYAPGGGF